MEKVEIEVSKLKRSGEAISIEKKREIFNAALLHWFTEENVDIRNKYPISVDEIVIKFPHITIRNSKNMTHEIRDLYLRFIADYDRSDGITLEDFGGMRGVITQAEFDSKYVHSHMRSYGFENDWLNVFSTCCFGSGILPEIIADLSMMKDEENMKILIDSFLINLDNYVQWESLEGNPYIRMESVSLKGNSMMLNSLPLSLRIRIRNEYLREFGNDIPLKVIVFRDGLTMRLLEGKKAISQLNQIIERPEFAREGCKVCSRYLENGNIAFYSVENKRSIARSAIMFKNQKIVTKILNPVKNDNERKGDYPHPELFNIINNTIKDRYEEFLKTKVEQYISDKTRRVAKSKNIDLSLCTDFLPAQEVSG